MSKSRTPNPSTVECASLAGAHGAEPLPPLPFAFAFAFAFGATSFPSIEETRALVFHLMRPIRPTHIGTHAPTSWRPTHDHSLFASKKPTYRAFC